MKQTHSKNSLFLMEILLNILLFSVLLVVGLQFFGKTHTLTQKTQQLHAAVTSCSNVASIFESGDGTAADILSVYPYSVNLDNKVIVYLDKNFNDCKKGQARYYITAKLNQSGNDPLATLTIRCRTIDQKELLYELKASHYTPLHVTADTRLKGVN